MDDHSEPPDKDGQMRMDRRHRTARNANTTASKITEGVDANGITPLL